MLGYTILIVCLGVWLGWAVGFERGIRHEKNRPKYGRRENR